MKHGYLLGTLMFAICGTSLAATASETDCFPLCAEQKVEAEVILEPGTISAARETASEGKVQLGCESAFMTAADELTEKTRPLREIVGYVRSPQGLAIKLVNDHVVKVPAWIGYAIDPLGSIKRQAMGEVRTRARNAMRDDNACVVAPLEEAFDSAGGNSNSDEVDAKHSI